MQNQSRQFKFDISEDTEASFPDNEPSCRQTDENNHSLSAQSELIPLDRISMDALLQTLVASNVVSHQQLSECENELRGEKNPPPMQDNPNRGFSAQLPEERIVQTYSNRPHEPVRFAFLRKIFSRFRWSRKLGSILFGWKWRRKRGHNGIDKFE